MNMSPAYLPRDQTKIKPNELVYTLQLATLQSCDVQFVQAV